MYRELLIGCGSTRDKRLWIDDHENWSNLTTLDINADHHPDIVYDLEKLPLSFMDNSFDEIHAYEVLEHLGNQGDYHSFFAQFSEFHRILKPKGLLFATVPHYLSLWAWGDPSHKRIINSGTLIFLSQKAYKEQVGITPMSDFRYLYKADFDIKYAEVESDLIFKFVLEAVK